MAMQQLNCHACGRGVLVEKYSAAHTSIQWMSNAEECPLIAAGHHGFGSLARRCEELRRTIDDAVASHKLCESQIELPVGAAIPRLH
ncbi:hypothetical protein GII33_21715 [Gordonia pseudamarae]|jgi:hypothetical protein|uniref:Uncharacterized protein n=1 Tax=Gordonia pseudamarae TaxID=2831662 RepID=A0ABX6IPN3_9ACTN|nr:MULTISPECIES: hypothetical protein [Gordonia]MBD0022185.1 hypothetical protein [Gordonia sp. (in: high G+C Gram-positive bacteria)]QHN28200.1 hypothetical protein GII33_21715 [Gordonia pseudamarae]QHN37061.1 hypothetical protein GII31_21345 [Gordonia pseudamarae]